MWEILALSHTLRLYSQLSYLSIAVFILLFPTRMRRGGDQHPRPQQRPKASQLLWSCEMQQYSGNVGEGGRGGKHQELSSSRLEILP